MEKEKDPEEPDSKEKDPEKPDSKEKDLEEPDSKEKDPEEPDSKEIVTLIFGSSPTDTIQCQKQVLIDKSDYFKAMFSSGMKESKSNKVEMKDVDSELMKMLIDFMMKGEINLTEDNVDEIKEAAILYQILDLMELCEYLQKDLSHDTCYKLFEYSKLYNLKPLHGRCKRHILYFFLQILKANEDFYSVDISILKWLLQQRGLNVKSEVVVSDTAEDWIYEDEENRTKYAPELSKFIHFEDMSPGYICYKTNFQFFDFSEKEVEEKRKEKKKQTIKNFRQVPEALLCVGIQYVTEDDKEAIDPKIYKLDLDESQSVECLTDMSEVIPVFKEYGGYSVCMKGKDLIISGGTKMFSRDNWNRDVYCYDTFENTWSKLTELRSGRRDHVSFVMNNCLYVLGGHGNGDYLNTMEKYDIIEDKWIEVAPSPRDGRHNAVVVICMNERNEDGYVYFFRDKKNVWWYELSEDRWSQIYLPITIAMDSSNSSFLWANSFRDEIYLIDSDYKLYVLKMVNQTLFELVETSLVLQNLDEDLHIDGFRICNEKLYWIQNEKEPELLHAYLTDLSTIAGRRKIAIEKPSGELSFSPDLDVLNLTTIPYYNLD